MDEPNPKSSHSAGSYTKKVSTETNKDKNEIDAVPTGKLLERKEKEERTEAQMADILKLDIDCFEEAFDYLEFKDLIKVGQTCKRLNQIVGHILREEYSNIYSCQLHCEKDGIYISKQCGVHKTKFSYDLIDRLQIADRDGFHHLRVVRPKLRHVKKLNFAHIKFSGAEIESLKNIFTKLECLDLYYCTLRGDFHESVLSLCPNLRSFALTQNFEKTIMIGRGDKWLQHTYPSLEHFRLSVTKSIGIDKVKTFLELNPNIQKLEIDQQHIVSFKNLWLASNIKLDELTLYNENLVGKRQCDLFNELHTRGFYKRLKLNCFQSINQKMVDKLAEINGLTSLSFYLLDDSVSTSLKLSGLKHLEELYLNDVTQCSDIAALPCNLKNLTAIKFYRASINSILPFIREAEELRKISISILSDEIDFNDYDIIDLTTLNEERKKLDNAQKITIYVRESNYVATKWALATTDISLIRLKREQSYKD